MEGLLAFERNKLKENATRNYTREIRKALRKSNNHVIYIKEKTKEKLFKIICQTRMVILRKHGQILIC